MNRFNFPAHALEDMKSKLNKIQDEIRFTVTITEDFFKKVDDAVILLKFQTEKRLLSLEKDSESNVNLIFHSPGLGTRIASVNIDQFRDLDLIYFILSWNPSDLVLKIGSSFSDSDMKVGYGREADFVLRPLGKHYSVRFGGPGVIVSGEAAWINGETLLRPTAFRAWKSTLDAIQILKSGSSTKGHVYDIIVANTIISILCTGFEVFCKRRFVELVLEGVKPDYDKLEKRIFTTGEREKRLIKIMRKEAKDQEISLIEYIVNRRRIDFGNWDECKQAYNRAYGIRFGVDLDVHSEILQNIQKYINHRHKVAHITPFENRIVGFGELPVGEPVTHIVDKAIEDFDIFIRSLNKYTSDIITNANK